MNFRLKDFDGPLDLLLMLISRDKLDIREIFLSDITEQYIAIVHSAEDLDMDEATDFLVMAATLMEIKSRALLPKPPRLEEGEEDPEEALIRRLEEYKRIRESTVEMKSFEAAAAQLFSKLPEEYPLPPQEVELVGLTLEGLTAALMRILERKPPEEPEEENHYKRREIRRDEHNVRECMLSIVHQLKAKKRVRFDEVFSEAPTREEVVTLFLALLELLKLGEAHIEQEEVYSEIWVLKGRLEVPEETEDPPLRPERKKRSKQ